MIHDEIVVEAPEWYAEEAGELVKREMEAAGEELLPDVPVEVEVEIAREWRK